MAELLLILTKEYIPGWYRWVPCMILGAIGLFFLVMTYGALYVSRKTGKYVSGVPCVGGLFIALAFLLSPCKWLAFLAFLDYGPWELLSMLIHSLIRRKKPEDKDKPDD